MFLVVRSVDGVNSVSYDADFWKSTLNAAVARREGFVFRSQFVLKEKMFRNSMHRKQLLYVKNSVFLPHFVALTTCLIVPRFSRKSNWFHGINLF